MKPLLFYTFVAMLLLGAIGELPPPFATPSVNNHPVVIPKPSDVNLKVPPGFAVDVWAEGFAKPRFMLLGDNGEIFLADSGADAESAAVGSKSGGGATGAVYVFPGGDPTKKKKLIERLDRPYGLARWKNYLYVAESGSIKRYPYDASKLTAGKGEEVVSLDGQTDGHWTRSL